MESLYYINKLVKIQVETKLQQVTVEKISKDELAENHLFSVCFMVE